MNSIATRDLPHEPGQSVTCRRAQTVEVDESLEGGADPGVAATDDQRPAWPGSGAGGDELG
ncbi:MAG TPA: hypothetical protein VE265_06640, partial [Actinomycetota bacterium]|nr:hypothetical protein [Actinomycetota bacterium]